MPGPVAALRACMHTCRAAPAPWHPLDRQSGEGEASIRCPAFCAPSYNVTVTKIKYPPFVGSPLSFASSLVMRTAKVRPMNFDSWRLGLEQNGAQRTNEGLSEVRPLPVEAGRRYPVHGTTWSNGHQSAGRELCFAARCPARHMSACQSFGTLPCKSNL